MINKYPYTDFNEYNMDWIIKTVKDLTVEWTETKTEWSDTKTEWESYKNYIDNYFNTLDVSQEISDKINDMIADGTFQTIIAPFFAEAIADVPQVVTNWINANLLQETGYVIDNSLTVANAAADAKAVGDIFVETLYNRPQLTSADDMDTILDPGCYYISAADAPANLPFDPHNGRVVVIKRSGGAHYENIIQIYATFYGIPHIYVRTSKSQSSATDAWNGVKWTELRLQQTDDKTNEIVGKAVKIPIVRGGLNTSGRYTIGQDNRCRPVNAYHDLFNFRLSGHKVKFYYYDGIYDYDELDSSVPSNFMFTTPWQNLDDPVTPYPGYWFTFMIAKQDDSAISEAELSYIKENLEAYDIQSPGIYMQTETLPYNALLYHAKWDDIVDGSVVKRVHLGDAYNDPDFPIYAYEVHTQRNSLTYNYQNVTYNGSNEVYPRKKVLIFGGMHGNEKCTPMDILALTKELINGSLTDIGVMFDWYIIPLVNPWGYSHVNLDENGHIIYRYGDVDQTIDASDQYNAGIRTNSLGMDINRDFSDVTFALGDYVYGFQTSEGQILQPYIQSTKWDIFIDVHQNNQDKNQSMGSGANAFAGIAYITSTDADYIKKRNKLYLTIDNAAKNTNNALQAYFRRKNASGQSFVVWNRKACNDASTELGISCNYMSGFPTGTHGNTLHPEIAADVPMTLETSELAWTYSQLSNQTSTPKVSWYNPIACSCSTTALAELIKSIANAYAFIE